MVSQDHIRGLPLFNQRVYNAVELPQLFWREINSGAGRGKKFLIMSLGGFGIVIILCMDGAFMPWFIAAIADKRSLLDLAAVLPFKFRADVITSVAGAA